MHIIRWIRLFLPRMVLWNGTIKLELDLVEWERTLKYIRERIEGGACPSINNY